MAALAFLLTIALLETALAIKSLKPCMDSVPDCIINPCTLATCPSFPAAECRDWMCGSECKPEFWANNAEVTSQCQTEKESSNPLAELLIPGSSNSVSTGDPVINTGTLGVISPPTQQSDGGCPQGTPVAMCTARPCAVTTCPAFPTASCTDSYCGGCNAIFRLNGEDVTSQCNSVGAGPGTCPAGQTLTRCSARPCAIKTCPAHPRASCTDNYCGGCNAIFKVGLRDVTSECNGNSGPQMMSSSQINNLNFQVQVTDCPPHRLTMCRRDPCTFSVCRLYPRATCRPSNCGGCYARYFLQGREVTRFCTRWGNPQLLPLWYMGFPDMIGLA